MIIVDEFKNYTIVSKTSTGTSLYEYNLRYVNHTEALEFAKKEADKNKTELVEKKWE